MVKSNKVLWTEMRENFGGIVRIPLMSFENGDSADDKSWLDNDKVLKLLNIFKIEGCHSAKWPVIVIVDRAKYRQITSHEGCSEDALRGDNAPILPKGIPVICAQGKHRLEAGRRFLPPDQYWWHAMLFVDVTAEVAQLLRRGDYQATSRKDGEIYRLMRLSRLSGDTAAAQTWEAQLCQSKSNSKLKDINQLCRAAEKPGPMRDFLAALDNLLPFQGLWMDFQVGCFHRLLTLRCPEEMTTYLKLIHWCWSRICGKYRRTLDPTTVNLLEGRMPARSIVDCSFIHASYDAGQIFSDIENTENRAQILVKILSITIRIPSLRTFLEDTKYLEVGACAMKTLLPKNTKDSIRQTLGIGICPIVKNDLQDQAMYTAYLKVWLFAFRNFPDLTDLRPRKEPGKPKPSCKGQSAIVWHRFAKLATDCGFDNIQIRQLLRNDARRHMCETFLKAFEDYTFSDITLLARDTVALMEFLDMRPTESRQAQANATSPLASHDVPDMVIERRYGRPFESMFLADRPYLYYENICKFPSDGSLKASPSSFDIQREIILSFFQDRTTEEGITIDTIQNSPQPDSRPATPSVMYNSHEDLNDTRANESQTVWPFSNWSEQNSADGMEGVESGAAAENPQQTLISATHHLPDMVQCDTVQTMPGLLQDDTERERMETNPASTTTTCQKVNGIIQGFQDSTQASQISFLLLGDGQDIHILKHFEEINNHDVQAIYVLFKGQFRKTIVAREAINTPGVYYVSTQSNFERCPLVRRQDGWHYGKAADHTCKEIPT